MFYKKAVLKSFTIFIGKHLCQSLCVSCNFYADFFSFSLTNEYLLCPYALLPAKRFVGSETPKHKAFDQFWKFKFHFKHVPRNTRFLSFDVPSNYSYLFKNHRQTFSWQGERLSSHVKVAKMWFGPNIKYLFGTLPYRFLLPERHLLLF